MSDLTLLDRRRLQLEEEIQKIYEDFEVLRKCHTGNYADLSDRIAQLKTSVDKAYDLSNRVEDLNDISRYGKSGGR